MIAAVRWRLVKPRKWAKRNWRVRDLSSLAVAESKSTAVFEAAIGLNHTKEPSNEHSFRSRKMETRRERAPNTLLGKTGGEIFHDLMIRHNVKHIFGYPGGAILPVFDAIYNSKHFQFILPRHEQGAGHMAQGYSRVTGKPGVVLVTSGPGATNLITPMMDALADGTPLVVFAGQVNTAMIGLDSFQEVDMLSMSQPCTKWNVRVRSPEELPRRVEEAFEIAARGRPGPVLVELPQDVTAGRAHERPPLSLSLSSRMSPAGMAMRQMERKSLNRAIGETARLINIAKKPIIYGGQGVLATPQGPLHLKSLADKASIPVTTSLQGLGAFDEDDPKALHMLGLHGAGYANMAMQHADLIIALGARFDDRVTGNITKFAPEANLAAIQGRGLEATVAVVGDCGSSLGQLLPHVNKAERPEWLAQIQAWKDKYPFSAYRCSGLGDQIQPQRVIERLNEMVAPIKDRTIITTGVGQHQMWAAQHFRWKYPRTMVTSGGLGTMGFGLPAAIGAKIARPDAVVIDIDGDASFNMTLSELQTASEFDIGVKVIILNNEGQGMVTHLQTVYYQNRFCQSHGLNPDFVRASEAMGVQAQCCSKLDEVDEKLKWLLETKGPAVLEVKVARESLTLPMVPSGCGLDEFQFYSN